MTRQCGLRPFELRRQRYADIYFTSLAGGRRICGDYAGYLEMVHAWLMGLDIVDGGLKVSPGIAERWELSPDGTTWTFTIRRGVKFHDGTDLTAADVAWSFNHSMGPQANDYTKEAVGLKYSAEMERIEQLTIDQVVLVSKVPIPEMGRFVNIKASGGAGPGIILPKREKFHDLEEELAYDRNPIGAGLIKLVAHRPGASMTFERFEDYYRQPANGFPNDHRLKIAGVKYVVAPEEATLCSGPPHRDVGTLAGELLCLGPAHHHPERVTPQSV